MTPAARVRLRVRGRVQGVGFRWHIRELGRRLGLAGYVRNEEDGAVLAEAEGPRDLVSTLEAAVRRGPDAARVDVVEVLPPGAAPLPHPFSVER